MQFRIFNNQNLIQGISDASFGSMAGKVGDGRAQTFLKVGRKNFGEIIKKAIKFIKQGKVLICPINH